MSARLLIHAEASAVSGGTRRVWVRTLLDGIATEPDAVPTLTESIVDESGSPAVWTVQGTPSQMLSAETDTAVVDGTLYYLDVSYTAETTSHLLAEATISSQEVYTQATHRADPPVPDHTHDGVDSPRVWWEDLLGVPDDIEGLAESPTLDIVEVEDGTLIANEGLREAAIRAHGFSEDSVAAAVASQALANQAPVERRQKFTYRFDQEPKRGDTLRLKQKGITVTIDRVEELGDGYYFIEAGPRSVVNVKRDEQRLSEAERYA